MAQSQLADLRPFPQLRSREIIKTDFLRALYARTTNNELAFRWINRDFIRGLHNVEVPPLAAPGARVACDLDANGIAFANFTEFFSSDFLAQLHAAFDGFRDEFHRANPAPKLKGKAVFLDVIHKSHTFCRNDVVSDYLADQQFAAIAAAYMNMVPRYVGSSFWHTKPAPGSRQDSQLWHRDYNDRRLVKVFLYLNDVGPDNGYFEYATGTHIKGPYGHKFDLIGSDGYRAYPDQDEIGAIIKGFPIIQLNAVPKSEMSGAAAPWHKKPSVVQCQAPAGTLIFADTFGVHRGGFVKANYRDLIMNTYSTNFNVHKPHFAVNADFATGLSPFMKMVFGVA